MSEKKHKIFISHNSRDREYAAAFVNLFRAMGLQRNEIVCSSVSGYGIPVGQDIYEWLKKQFEEFDLHVIFLLSDKYYDSPASLNEMGASWVLRTDYDTIILPGFKFENIKGAVNPRQVGLDLSKADNELRVKANELRHRITEKFTDNQFDEYDWENGLYKFISEIDRLKSSSNDESSLKNHRKEINYNQKPQIIIPDIEDTFLFGNYPQDNSGKKKPIEWIVLDKKGSELLLLSKYGLDCKKYNDTRKSVTWETCTLRTWLNARFLNIAFNSTEQGRIMRTTVKAEKNPDYDTNPGKDTEDQIFLLNIQEVNYYNKRKCKPTKYAEESGASTNSDGYCWWWLRSPGGGSLSAAYVGIDGSVFEIGSRLLNVRVAVRPALWVNLKS